MPAVAIFHRLAEELPLVAEDHPLGEEIVRAQTLLLDLPDSDTQTGSGPGSFG